MHLKVNMGEPDAPLSVKSLYSYHSYTLGRSLRLVRRMDTLARYERLGTMLHPCLQSREPAYLSLLSGVVNPVSAKA